MYNDNGTQQFNPSSYGFKTTQMLTSTESDYLIESIRAEIRKTVPPEQYDQWFSRMEISSITDNSITFAVPGDSIKNRICADYLEFISSIVYKLLHPSFEIDIISTEKPAITTQMQLQSKDNDISNANASSMNIVSLSSINKRYTFENFVVAAYNRMAHAAAVSVAGSPGYAYNPLFIHGASGLGKTHLMHAINNFILQQGRLKTFYLSCEHFVNHYISAIQSNNMEAFRKFYRNVDVLLMDDIQFFENSYGSREEFFHTFNALYNDGKQIVITSNYPPESIAYMEDRLVSRFKWGLVCGISTPSLETRAAIVEKRAAAWNIKVSHESAVYLAENIPGNIRELEGAIARLSNEAKATNNAVSFDFIRKVSREISGSKKTVSIEAVLGAISKKFNVSVSELLSKRRTRTVALPRQIAMHLSRKLTNMSLTEIGGYLGGRDHSTVIHGDETIIKKAGNDKNLSFIIQKLEGELLK